VPEGDRKDNDRLLNKDDPIVIDLVQRVSRLEERVSGVEREINWLKESVREIKSRIESVDSKTWAILVSVILTILVQILFKVVPR